YDVISQIRIIKSKMRLLTHNILICNRSECRNGFPLEISLNGSVEESTKMLDVEFNIEQIKQIIKKVDWGVLVKSASQFGLSLPLSYSEQDFDDEVFLCAVHDAILRFQIMEAELICPICNHRYIVSKGVPDMIFSSLVSKD
ncbi:Trm112p-like protein, partial [Cryptosporidium parvum]